MQLGQEVRFHSLGRDWVLRPFSLGFWFAFCKWCKANLDEDPLAMLKRLPLENMSKESVDAKVKEAIDEDKIINTYTPESESTIRRLSTPQGLIKALELLLDGTATERECDNLVTYFVMSNQVEVLVGYIGKCVGKVDELSKKVEAGAGSATGNPSSAD